MSFDEHRSFDRQRNGAPGPDANEQMAWTPIKLTDEQLKQPDGDQHRIKMQVRQGLYFGIVSIVLAVGSLLTSRGISFSDGFSNPIISFIGSGGPLIAMMFALYSLRRSKPHWRSSKLALVVMILGGVAFAIGFFVFLPRFSLSPFS